MRGSFAVEDTNKEIPRSLAQSNYSSSVRDRRAEEQAAMKSAAVLRAAAAARTSFQAEAYLRQARQLIASRPAKPMFDILTPVRSHLLNISLADHIPRTVQPIAFAATLAAADGTAASDPLLPAAGQPMPLGHHSIFFPPQLRSTRLTADGTDPDHAPGAPFVRRMWAGGSISFGDSWEDQLRLDGRRAVCVESVGEPVLKTAAAGRDMVFVDVVRKYGPVLGDDDTAAAEKVTETPVLEEVRRLVFLREPPEGSNADVKPDTTRRVVKGKPPPLCLLRLHLC
jgi:hypothetical protein